MINDALEKHLDLSHIDMVCNNLKILSNPDRLKILCVLIENELNVQQIEHHTQIRQPTLSQQLSVLRNHEIVSTRRESKQIFYQLNDVRILKIMRTLYEIYCKSE